jgi:hypothetical protein
MLLEYCEDNGYYIYTDVGTQLEELMSVGVVDVYIDFEEDIAYVYTEPREDTIYQEDVEKVLGQSVDTSIDSYPRVHIVINGKGNSIGVLCECYDPLEDMLESLSELNVKLLLDKFSSGSCCYMNNEFISYQMYDADFMTTTRLKRIKKEMFSRIKDTLATYFVIIVGGNIYHGKPTTRLKKYSKSKKYIDTPITKYHKRRVKDTCVEGIIPIVEYIL